MARRIIPQAHVTIEGKNEVTWERTYAKLKPQIKDLIKKSDDDHLYVYRSKRGDWGEWFERWELENGKPTIIKEGWS